MGTLTASLVRNPSVDTARGIATMDDTGDHIIIQCTMTSAAAITAAGGTVTGSPDIDADGLTQVDNSNKVVFTDVPGYQSLDYAGQIVFDVTTQKVSVYDNDTTAVNGSNGSDLSAAQYLFGTKSGSGAGTNAGCLFMNTAQQLTARVGVSDTNAVGGVTSVGKSATTQVCYWWKGTEFGVMIDGSPLITGTRASFEDNWFHIFNPGAGFSFSSQLFTGKIKNLVVSRIPPTFYTHRSVRRIGIFGDSHAKQMSTATNPRFDCAAVYQIMKHLAAKGMKAQVTNDGVSGGTVADGTGTNLSDSIAAFAAKQYDVCVLMPFNNDKKTTTISDVEYADASTGSDANIKKFIEQIMFTDYPTNTVRSRCTRVIVATPGSMYQSDFNTAANNARRVLLHAIVEALPAWWDATYAAYAGMVESYDYFASMGGDSTVNYNYQGQYNLDGNGFNTPALDDQHLSVEGQTKLGLDLYQLIF